MQGVRDAGHLFRETRQSGDRWMVKWRDATGQHQRVLGKVWEGRGKPSAGYLTKRGAQHALDEILATPAADSCSDRFARPEA